jgi:hypothetical protein
VLLHKEKFRTVGNPNTWVALIEGGEVVTKTAVDKREGMLEYAVWTTSSAGPTGSK